MMENKNWLKILIMEKRGTAHIIINGKKGDSFDECIRQTPTTKVTQFTRDFPQTFCSDQSGLKLLCQRGVCEFTNEWSTLLF